MIGEQAMEIFSILKDNDKLNIILLLLGGEYCVCDLEEVLGIRQTTLSNKLKTLRDNQIIVMRKEKNWRYYSLNQEFCMQHSKLMEYLVEENGYVIAEKQQCITKSNE